MTLFNLTDRQWFTVDVVRSSMSVIVALFGVYFIMRWGITLVVVDKPTRDLLLGETASNMMNDMKTIQILVAIYVGFSFLVFMTNVVKWKRYLEKERIKLENNGQWYS